MSTEQVTDTLAGVLDEQLRGLVCICPAVGKEEVCLGFDTRDLGFNNFKSDSMTTKTTNGALERPSNFSPPFF